MEDVNQYKIIPGAHEAEVANKLKQILQILNEYLRKIYRAQEVEEANIIKNIRVAYFIFAIFTTSRL